MHVKNGGAVGGEWGETVIVIGGGGKEVEVEGVEQEGEGGWWGVKVKRARCLGIFQFLRPVWCFLFSPRLALCVYVFLFLLLPLLPQSHRGWDGRGKGSEEEAGGYRSK